MWLIFRVLFFALSHTTLYMFHELFLMGIHPLAKLQLLYLLYDNWSQFYISYAVFCAVLSDSVVSDPMDCSSSGSSGPWRFSRQEFWCGLPCPPPGDLPNPGIEPRSLTLQVDSLLSEPPGKALHFLGSSFDHLPNISHDCSQATSHSIYKLDWFPFLWSSPFMFPYFGEWGHDKGWNGSPSKFLGWVLPPITSEHGLIWI